MNARSILAAILLPAPLLYEQSGTVRIRVIDSHGAAVPGSAVSLADSWDRTVRTLSTNRTGEVLWNHERTITLRVAPPPTGADQFVVNYPGPPLDIEPMPICETLDPPEPSRNK